MKKQVKLILPLLGLASIISVASCGKKNSSDENTRSKFAVKFEKSMMTEESMKVLQYKGQLEGTKQLCGFSNPKTDWKSLKDWRSAADYKPEKELSHPWTHNDLSATSSFYKWETWTNDTSQYNSPAYQDPIINGMSLPARVYFATFIKSGEQEAVKKLGIIEKYAPEIIDACSASKNYKSDKVIHDVDRRWSDSSIQSMAYLGYGANNIETKNISLTSNELVINNLGIATYTLKINKENLNMKYDLRDFFKKYWERTPKILSSYTQVIKRFPNVSKLEDLRHKRILKHNFAVKDSIFRLATYFSSWDNTDHRVEGHSPILTKEFGKFNNTYYFASHSEASFHKIVDDLYASTEVKNGYKKRDSYFDPTASSHYFNTPIIGLFDPLTTPTDKYKIVAPLDWNNSTEYRNKLIEYISHKSSNTKAELLYGVDPVKVEGGK